MNAPPWRRPNSHTPISVVPVTYFRNIPTSSPAQVHASKKATTAKRTPIGERCTREEPAELATVPSTGWARASVTGVFIGVRLLAWHDE